MLENCSTTNHEEQLGFYEDGTERTLTDEQIAMFRHSEIQRLIRRHQIGLENADDDNAMADDSERERKRKRIESPVTKSNNAVILLDSLNHVKETTCRKTVTYAVNDSQSSLKKSAGKKKRKRSRPEIYKPEKQDKKKFMHKEEDRTFRRICREADDLKNSEVELDY